MMQWRWACALAVLAACGEPRSELAYQAASQETGSVEPVAPQLVVLPSPPSIEEAPRGLPETPSPAQNPTSAEKVALGELLFFDTRLSSSGGMACADCHPPEKGWASPQPRTKTVAGKLNLRHTPTLLNAGYAPAFFWDGRVERLEPMILANWKGQLGAEPDIIAALLERIPEYQAHFLRAFDGPVTADHIAEALAAFVRTVQSGDAPWDRYESGDQRAVSADVIAGYRLFTGKAQCALCHPPPLYTDFGYHDLGVSPAGPDVGRAMVTRREADRGKFKTPSLRSVELTAPYFHDGSAATLAEALNHLLAQTIERSDPPVILTAKERAQLLAFMRALTGSQEPGLRPKLPTNPPLESDG